VTLLVETVPFKIYGSGVGIVLNTEALTPKFFASTSSGVCAIHYMVGELVIVAFVEKDRKAIESGLS
jgi:hypothetical protein